MSSPRIQLNDVVQAPEKITPAEILLTPQPDNYEVKIAYNLLVKRAYYEVTELLSFVTDFFPFISGAEYEYPPTFPRDRLEMGKDSPLQNKTFKVQKKGMESGPSLYEYKKAVFTNEPEQLSLITLQTSQGGDKNTFRYFYNAIQCMPDANGNAILHVESGYTASTLTRAFGADIAADITGNTIIATLERINIWMTNPIEALQQRITRLNLVNLNPPMDQGKPIEYTSQTTFACSTQQLLNVLGNTPKMVDNVLMCEMRSNSYNRFAKKVPCVDDIELEVKSKEKISFLFATKSKLGLNLNKLSIELAVGEEKPNYGTQVLLTTQGSFKPKDSISELRVFFKEWMADLNAKITGRLATVVKQTYGIADVTPVLNSTETVPEVLRPGFGFKS